MHLTGFLTSPMESSDVLFPVSIQLGEVTAVEMTFLGTEIAVFIMGASNLNMERGRSVRRCEKEYCNPCLPSYP